jgi:hypothetical protein
MKHSGLLDSGITLVLDSGSKEEKFITCLKKSVPFTLFIKRFNG